MRWKRLPSPGPDHLTQTGQIVLEIISILVCEGFEPFSFGFYAIMAIWKKVKVIRDGSEWKTVSRGK